MTDAREIKPTAKISLQQAINSIYTNASGPHNGEEKLALREIKRICEEVRRNDHERL